eukprot:172058_1
MGVNVEKNIMFIEETEDYTFEYTQYATLDIKDVKFKIKMTNILVKHFNVYDVRDFKWQASFNIFKHKFDEHKVKLYGNKPVSNCATGGKQKYVNFIINDIEYTDQIKLVRLGTIEKVTNPKYLPIKQFSNGAVDLRAHPKNGIKHYNETYDNEDNKVNVELVNQDHIFKMSGYLFVFRSKE